MGERVYIRSSSNRDRHGEAVVTSVSGKQYTLEVLSEKDMRLGESIKVYRDEDFVSSSCIGSGDLSRVDPKPVAAEGYVLAVHVQPGQQVSRGDLLFEIVPDRLNGMQGGDGSVSMPEDGVLLSISAQSGQTIAKDAPMATYCPRGQVKLVCAVDEDEIASVEVGDELSVTLDAYDGETLKGTVVRIAGASVSGEGAPAFDVTLELEESEHVRIGMNATAVKAGLVKASLVEPNGVQAFAVVVGQLLLTHVFGGAGRLQTLTKLDHNNTSQHRPRRFFRMESFVL